MGRGKENKLYRFVKLIIVNWYFVNIDLKLYLEFKVILGYLEDEMFIVYY